MQSSNPLILFFMTMGLRLFRPKQQPVLSCQSFLQEFPQDDIHPGSCEYFLHMRFVHSHLPLWHRELEKVMNLSLINQVIDCWCYNVNIVYVYTNNIKISSCGFFKAVYLINWFRCYRCHIFIFDIDNLIFILLNSIFKSKTNCIPPCMN